MAALRILIVTGIFPPDIGGPATYVPQIAACLAGRGHQVIVLTLSDAPSDPGDTDLPFRLIRLARKTPLPLRWATTVATIVQLGRQADLVFVNGLQLEAAVANLLLQRPLIQKVVGDSAWERARRRQWTSDDFEAFQRRRYGPMLELQRALRSWWAKRADQVIVPSQYLADHVAGWGVAPKNIRVIFNGVELTDTAPLAIPLSAPLKIITVARLVPWKHVDGIIAALAHLPEAGLVVVGDGPERARLETLAAQPAVAGRVYFAGQCSRAETHGLLRGSDIFVLNSSYEGLPHVLIEALAAGLPVVATAVGGTPELVEHGRSGLLVPPNNPAALAAALAVLANAPDLRQRLAAEGHATSTRFTRRTMLDASVLLLEKHAAKRAISEATL